MDVPVQLAIAVHPGMPVHGRSIPQCDMARQAITAHIMDQIMTVDNPAMITWHPTMKHPGMEDGRDMEDQQDMGDRRHTMDTRATLEQPDTEAPADMVMEDMAMVCTMAHRAMVECQIIMVPKHMIKTYLMVIWLTLELMDKTTMDKATVIEIMVRQ